MMPAQYFCSGEIPKDQWHHYGLAAPVYTHFTSPIRRYADVIVHRLLAASIGVISLPAANADRSRQQDLCSHMNRRHRAAQYVQRASVNLHTLLYFKNRPSEEPAYVLSVNEEQFVVLIPKFGIEGVIRFDMVSQHMPRGTIVEHDADKHCARMVSDGGSGSGSGSGSGKEVFKVRVFQQVRVCIRVRESSAGDRKLVIGLVHEGKALLDEADAIATDGDTMEVIVDDEDIIDGDGDDDDDDDDDDDMNSSSTAGIAGRSGMKRSLGAAERSPKRSKKSAPARGTRSKR
jgi:exosome complex exonuclease DIS3/RRP44